MARPPTRLHETRATWMLTSQKHHQKHCGRRHHATWRLVGNLDYTIRTRGPEQQLVARLLVSITERFGPKSPHAGLALPTHLVAMQPPVSRGATRSLPLSPAHRHAKLRGTPNLYERKRRGTVRKPIFFLGLKETRSNQNKT